MGAPIEQPVQLQTDTLTTLPGGIRTIVATLMVNGVPTPVQMQVISVADANGVILDDFPSYTLQNAMIAELREIKRLIAMQLGVPIFEQNTTPAPLNTGM